MQEQLESIYNCLSVQKRSYKQLLYKNQLKIAYNSLCGVYS